MEISSCGICLVDEKDVDRGKLDCCDHFFCFVCILEWSKVESKCPYCKKRFVTITKPGRSGITRSRTVRVPTRDQVHVASEEEHFDPHSTLVCSECCESGRDGALLLCDGCDSAAHTYCIGLSRVPRGEWFCSRCSERERSPSGASAEAEDEQEVVFLDSDGDDKAESIVVRNTMLRNARVGGASRNCPVYIDDEEEHTTRQQVEQSATLDEMAGNLFSGVPSARTLTSQRAVQQRIQMFRDRWEEFRNGTQEFERDNTEVARPKPEKTAEERDIAKAWRKMEQAKSSCSQQQHKPPATRGRNTVGKQAETRQAEAGTSFGRRPSILYRQAEAARSMGAYRPAAATMDAAQKKGRAAGTAQKKPAGTMEAAQKKEPAAESAEKKGSNSRRIEMKPAEPPVEELESNSAPTYSSSSLQGSELLEQEGSSQPRREKRRIEKIEDVQTRKTVKMGLCSMIQKELQPLFNCEEISKQTYKDTARAAVHILLDVNSPQKLMDWGSEDMKEQAREVVAKLLSMEKEP